MTIRRTPLRRVSAKRSRELREYSTKRKAFLTARPTCEKCGTRKSCDVHHKAGRLGGKYLNEATWAALCRPCHDWLHSHPSKARATGWMV